MYGELIEEIISKYKPITTQRIHSILIDLIGVSKNENEDELDLKGKINKYFDIKNDINNGSSISGFISGHSAGFSQDNNNYQTGFSQSSNMANEITEEIPKDDKYWEFIKKIFEYLLEESDENIEHFFKDLYETIKNDLTEISEVSEV